MSSTLLLQSVISGVTSGFIYALMGIGLAVVFRGARIINVTQGEFAVIGALITVLFVQYLQWPYWMAIVVGVAAGALSGVVVDVVFVRPMLKRKAADHSFLLLTIGLAFTIGAAALYIGGRSSHVLPSFGGDRILDIGQATVREHALWLIAIATAVVLGLRWFYKKTLLGLSMTAASNDPDGAATTGINVSRCRLVTFIMGGALGAVAGILVTPLISMNYNMGVALTLKGFAAAILGGLLNPLGALAGGLTLGLLESLSLVAFPSGYRDVVAMALLILIMILLPHGMLGRAGRKGG
jgi:branched-chain amino acid transport system permease protein